MADLNIDEAFETVRGRLTPKWAMDDPTYTNPPLRALDTIREELEREGAIQARLDAKLTQAYGTIAGYRTQLERQEAALRDIGLATIHCTHGSKVRRILERHSLSTPPNQEGER